MPRGASQKREREYEELKSKFKKNDRYKGREEEVAARIVNKQRAQYGETKKAKSQKKQGRSPDQDLPIDDYRAKTVSEVENKLGDLSKGEIRKLKNYEKNHKNRKTLIQKYDDAMKSAA